MPVQIIDKKAGCRPAVHPLQHVLQFFIAEMMTEKRRKNDIGYLAAKINLFIICRKELRARKRQAFAGNADTVRIVIYTRQLHADIVFPAPAVNGQQVIAAPAANFTYRHRFPVLQQLSKTTDRYGMTAEPGIDKIKLLHILPDIGKGNTLPIQQFFPV